MEATEVAYRTSEGGRQIKPRNPPLRAAMIEQRGPEVEPAKGSHGRPTAHQEAPKAGRRGRASTEKRGKEAQRGLRVGVLCLGAVCLVRVCAMCVCCVCLVCVFSVCVCVRTLSVVCACSVLC